MLKSYLDKFSHGQTGERYEREKCHRSHTCILGEADSERRSEDFLLEEIFLVEEENNGGIAEPLVVANGIKQF